jgi:predicted O-linked N-acetylglucosamine transferase (SPINDLY family)
LTPLVWPRRTAGRALRVGVFTGSRADRDAWAKTLFAAVGSELCEGTLLVAQDRASASSAPSRPLSDAPAHSVPDAPDAAARTVAALDLDVLIDATGIGTGSGPLAALHPARAWWAVAIDGDPVPEALYDRVFRGDGDTCVAMLRSALDALYADIDAQPCASIGAAELSQQWTTAVGAHRAGDVEAARSGYAAVLAQQPEFAPAHFLKGAVARDAGGTDEAQAEFGAAVALAPDFVDARAALAGLLIDVHDAARAAAVAREGLARDPRPALWRALGRAELARGDGGAAFAAFSEALAREPLDAETHYNQGVALQMQRDAAAAADAYRRAVALAPDLHAAHFNLGVVFQQRGDAAGAIEAFRQALARAPAHAQSYAALAEALLAAGRLPEWFDTFARFERHCPDHIALAVLALEVSAYRGDHRTLDRYLDGLRHDRYAAADPTELVDALQQLLFLLLYFDVEPALVDRYARMHDRVSRDVYGGPMQRPQARRPGRLRIGYLSGDFRNHVMGKMIAQALRHHDATRFETFGYATTDAHDEWTARIAATFAHFESLGALSDREAARRIAEADLDVLVDLSTHTKGARPAILAVKPARVQITHIASAGTAAMSAIDFKLTDHYADRADSSAFAIEAPLVMEGCVYPFRHIEPAERFVVARGDLRLPADAIVIGAFCTPLKLSRRCLLLWRDVLTRIPQAVLAFSPLNPGYRNAYMQIAAAAGIESARLLFLPQGRDDAENQARYRLIDFVLDPMPYGGVNGTLEALDMGVPVVTLVGARHGERSSYSILANLGVTGTVAHTGRDYVEIAVRLATEPAFRDGVRAQIAAGLAHSALTDMPAHTRNLEHAYVMALEQRALPAILPA